MYTMITTVTKRRASATRVRPSALLIAPAPTVPPQRHVLSPLGKLLPKPLRDILSLIALCAPVAKRAPTRQMVICERPYGVIQGGWAGIGQP